MIINTTAKVSIPDALIEKILKKSTQRLAKGIDKARKKIHNKIKELIIRQIESSSIMQELRSKISSYQGRRTLRGEFGLTEAMANEAASVIVSIIENSIKEPQIVQRETRTSTVFDINVDGLDPEYRSRLKNSPSLQYTSDPSGETIPWMKWLLDGNAHIRRKYGIFYPKIVSVNKSRSGQAIMIRDSSLQKTKAGKKRKRRRNLTDYYFPYNLPPELLTKGSAQDFIDEALRSTRFIGRLKILIELELREEINKLK